MGKHRALRTLHTAVREDIVKERFEDLADRIDSGVSSNPHTIWTSKDARHSTIPDEGTLWHYLNGEWISDDYIKELEATARRMNPARRNNDQYDNRSSEAYEEDDCFDPPGPQRIHVYPYGAWSNYDQERYW